MSVTPGEQPEARAAASSPHGSDTPARATEASSPDTRSDSPERTVATTDGITSPAVGVSGGPATESSAEVTPAVSMRGLTKKFGDFTAVDNMTLDVAKGEVYGFLGPNGCGKTTTMRMLTGSITPTSGSAEVLGVDIGKSPELVRPRIGYMSQKFSLFSDLTVDENLSFYAGAYGVPIDVYEERREGVLTMSGLHGREKELTANLSVGLRQRLALGVATIHRPELLFLDEPTGGVDPVARRAFWDLLYELSAGGVTLFVTTHYMEEVSNCTRMAFMYAGRLVADDSPSRIREAMATPENPRPSIEDVFLELVEREERARAAE